MPRKWLQTEDRVHTTRQKGTRNRARAKGIGSYCRKGKAKYADRYTRPYLTGEYLQWKSYYRGQEEYEPVSSRPRMASGHNKSKRPSNGINSTGGHQ